MRHQERQPHRGRLRRPRLLARDVARRHGALLDREERRAGVAIEHEEPTGLGRLSDRGHETAAAGDVDQHRLRGEVVVPEVVVHGLERPHDLAGGPAQGHDRVGMRAGAGPKPSEEVRAGAGGGHEDEVAGGVDVEHRPGVGGAGPTRLAGQRAPAPAHRTGARVEGAHDPAPGVGVPVVADRRSGDHEIAEHRRRRSHLIVGRAVDVEPLGQPHGAAGAKAGAGASGDGVERQQPRVDGRGEDAARAGGIRVGCRIAPGRHAARRHFAEAAAAVDAGVEAPLLGTGDRIEGDHLSVRRAEIETAVEMDGGRLERQFVSVPGVSPSSPV